VCRPTAGSCQQQKLGCFGESSKMVELLEGSLSETNKKKFSNKNIFLLI
jgi:hypothetical protein